LFNLILIIQNSNKNLPNESAKELRKKLKKQTVTELKKKFVILISEI